MKTVCFSSLSLALWVLTGCGPSGPDIATVHGTVTMDGQPLPNATVVFSPEAGGRPAGAATDSEGYYELNFSGGRKGTIPGPNVVRITTATDPYEDEQGNPVPAAPEIVPMRYNAYSELAFDVKAGEDNEANFDLESDGEVMEDTSY